MVDEQSAGPRAERGERDEKQESPIPPAVEDITGKNDKGILQPKSEPVVDRRVPDRPVDEKDDGQEECKFERVEQHRRVTRYGG